MPSPACVKAAAEAYGWDTRTSPKLRGDGDILTAYVSADAFCWSMVRSLVGEARPIPDVGR